MHSQKTVHPSQLTAPGWSKDARWWLPRTSQWWRGQKWVLAFGLNTVLRYWAHNTWNIHLSRTASPFSTKRSGSNQRTCAFGQTAQDIQGNGAKSYSREICSADRTITLPIAKLESWEIIQANFMTKTGLNKVMKAPLAFSLAPVSTTVRAGASPCIDASSQCTERTQARSRKYDLCPWRTCPCLCAMIFQRSLFMKQAPIPLAPFPEVC